MTTIQKPSRAEYEELKDFKLRVGLEMYNAIQLRENHFYSNHNFMSKLEHTVKIGDATFTFYANSDVSRSDIEKHLKKFTTSRW